MPDPKRGPNRPGSESRMHGCRVPPDASEAGLGSPVLRGSDGPAVAREALEHRLVPSPRGSDRPVRPDPAPR
ncbi:hypothetical protein GCM10027162_41980 [Streptomyces incanus]